jgi:uncharacterized protein
MKWGRAPFALAVLLSWSGAEASQDLFNALYQGNMQEFRSLLAAGADPNAKSKEGQPILATALILDRVEGARLLLEKGADPNAKDHNLMPVLHYLLYGEGVSKLELLDLMVRSGADVNLKDPQGTNAMNAAIVMGRTDLARALFKKGTELKPGTNHALTKAILTGDLAAARAAIAPGEDLNGKEYMPLFTAAGLGEAAISKLLIEKGAKPDAELPGGHTPLFFAAGAGHVEVCRVLLDHGAKMGRTGDDLVYHAALRGRGDVVKLLLQRGGRLDMEKDRGSGMTTWDVILSQKGAAGVLRALEEAGVKYDVARKNKHGGVALPGAINTQNLALTQFLVERGADASAQGFQLALAGAASGETGFIDIAEKIGYKANQYESPHILQRVRALEEGKQAALVASLEKIGVQLDEASRREIMLPQALAKEKAGDAGLALGSPAEALIQYVDALKLLTPGDGAESRVRKKAVEAAAKLRRPPLPEEANRRTVRAQTFIEQAKKPEDFRKAAAELEAASQVAPWEPGIYYNLALVQEKAGDFAGAIRSLNWYLFVDPQAKDASAVKNKVYKLEAQQELAGKN